MIFKIKQNGEFITINSFDNQYFAFIGEEPHSDTYGRWFNLLECVFNTWGDMADYTDKKYSYLRKRMNIKDSRAIPAKDAAHCLMVWATLNSTDMEDAMNTLNFIKSVVDFFNSLEETTFYFEF